MNVFGPKAHVLERLELHLLLVTRWRLDSREEDNTRGRGWMLHAGTSQPRQVGR